MIPLAQRIKEQKLNYKIILTINASDSNSAKKILDKIKINGLENVIENIGYVKMEDVPALYKACDALLMPTTLESFSGTYVEAMYHNKPIITSNKDFAKEICGEGAEYFNPLDEKSILNSIESVFKVSGKKELLIELGNKRLKSFLTWEEVFFEYEALINFDESSV